MSVLTVKLIDMQPGRTILGVRPDSGWRGGESGVGDFGVKCGESFGEGRAGVDPWWLATPV
jgi:hypothetical protein